MRVIPFGADGAPLSAERLPISAPVVSDLTFSPPMLGFGVVEIGEVCEQTVVLSSRKGIPFEIVSLHPDTSEVCAESLSPAAADVRATLRVSIRPTSTGKRSFTVAIEVKTKRGAAGKFLKLPVRYYGIENER